MSPADWQSLVLAVGGIIGSLAAFGKYMLNRADKRQAAAEKIAAERQKEIEAERNRILKERDESNQLVMAAMQREIGSLNEKVQSMEKDKRLYMRRVYQLEAFIHGLPGIDLPLMTDWPPV